MLFSYNDLKTFLLINIKGILKDKSTGARLEDVHIFIKDGDNEDFTDAGGAFFIQTNNTKGFLWLKKKAIEIFPFHFQMMSILLFSLNGNQLQHIQNFKNFK